MSGDWRKLRPNARTAARLELIAVLSVNSPGFMAPRNRALVASGAQTLIASGALVIADPEPIEVKPVPASKRIALDQVIAASKRATRCAAAAQRVRDARLSMIRGRVEHLGSRRVETTEGARHYGQPVGSIIITDGPDEADGDTPSADGPISYGPDYVARGLKLYMEPTTLEFRQRAAAGELDYDELLDQLSSNGHVGQWWGIMDSPEDPNYFGSIEDFEGYGHVETSESVARELRDYQESLDDGDIDVTDYSDSVNMGIVMVADRPEINGEPFDPDNNAQVDGGLMGNSYLPDGTRVTVREIRYDAGNGWVSLRGNRVVSTSPSAEDEELTASAAPKTDDQKAKPLERYWTQGKGLARWAESPTPFRTLVKELRKEIPADEMTDKQLKGLAATYYRKVKGEWPGRRSGGKDKASRLALAAERARMGRLALVASKIGFAAKHRRVETPAGADHYGQPVGSIIVTDGPDAPDVKTPATKKADGDDDKADPLPRGFEKKYRGDDVESVPLKDVYGITEALVQWDANSKSEHNAGGTMEGDLTDYDLPATATDLIRSGINASFLHTGVGPGGEHEIEDDNSGNAEWDRLGGIINDALLRNQREEPRPTDPDVFGPRRQLSEMTNSEIADLYADISVLTEGEIDQESMRAFIGQVARRGLNVRAGLDDSAVTPDVRDAVRENLWAIWTRNGV
ncbi:hypothetical protein BJF84_21210 [Rhodococcus sp. CUA-806]|nr:hypothetical protein BJF84_21210 [Rhodococcus sp. CUA-806]